MGMPLPPCPLQSAWVVEQTERYGCLATSERGRPKHFPSGDCGQRMSKRGEELLCVEAQRHW